MAPLPIRKLGSQVICVQALLRGMLNKALLRHANILQLFALRSSCLSCMHAATSRTLHHSIITLA